MERAGDFQFTWLQNSGFQLWKRFPHLPNDLDSGNVSSQEIYDHGAPDQPPKKTAYFPLYYNPYNPHIAG